MSSVWFSIHVQFFLQTFIVLAFISHFTCSCEKVINAQLEQISVRYEINSYNGQNLWADNSDTNHYGDNTLISICRYVMTEAKVPESVSDKYLSGSRVSTHGSDFLMFFHYGKDDTQEFREAKSRFRSLIKEFMETGKIAEWSAYPTVYAVSGDSDTISDDWTNSSCARWNFYYPAYSWMN